MNGSRRNVPKLAISSPTASGDRLLSGAARDVGVRRIELVRPDPRVDERALAVHVLGALLEAPALPALAASGLVRAVEPVREDALRHVDLDPADRVDQLAKAVEVDDDDVVDRQAREGLDGGERERRATDLVRRVDLRRAVAGDLDLEVARDREVRDPVRLGLEMDEHERVRAVGVAPTGRTAAVGADEEHRRRLREQRAVTLRQLRPCVARKPVVGLLDATRERAVSEDAPDGREHEETDEGERDPQPPASTTPLRSRRAGGLFRGTRRAWRGTLPFLRPPRYSR